MTGWRVHAWVLMRNHYHLLLETPEPNLVTGMQWLQNAYTRRFNTRHRLWGRLFGDRYKAVLVEGANYYYLTAINYIHLNPVRARIVSAARGESILDYPWSSVAGGYALLPSRRPAWLAGADLLQALGDPDTTAGRRKFVEHLDRRAADETPTRCGVPDVPAEADGRRSHLRRGWYWGTQEFAERALKLADAVLPKPRHRSSRAAGEKQAHGERDAERLLTSSLDAARLTPSELPALPGSDPRKLAIARVIWEHTTVSMSWLAERLALRSRANASQQLRRHRQNPPKLPTPLRQWASQSQNVA